MNPPRPDAAGRPIAAERSAYAAVCTLFERTYPTPRELSSAHIAGAQMSIFEMPEENVRRVFSAPFASPVFRQPFQHPTALELGERILYLQLRYCLSCMKHGHHSALFQNALVQQCPVHHEPLRTGCPECGQRISTTLKALSSSPFHCADCGVSFRTARLLGHSEKPLSTEPFKAIRNLLGLLDAAATLETSRGLLRWQLASRELRETAPDNALIRAASRHVDWQRHCLGTPSWAQRTMQIKDMSNGEGVYVDGEVIVSALIELKKLIRRKSLSTDLPAERPWVYLRNHALNANMPAAAVALCRTANAYGLLEYVVGKRRRPKFLLQAFGRLPDTEEGAAIVARYEVLGLFARFLGEAAATIYTDDVDWLHTPNPETFCPAWRLIRRDSVGELQLRLLADMSRIEVLIHRLGAHRLELSRARQGYVTRSVPRVGPAKDDMLTAQRGRRYDGRLDLHTGE